ncbi:hypothetical protein RKD19_000790 [Streptomyces canus]|uniref:hypothetical protein n=1 Tax=unclassified Streptomyces TaxID=2593676 RepID=UPI00379DA8FB
MEALLHGLPGDAQRRADVGPGNAVHAAVLDVVLDQVGGRELQLAGQLGGIRQQRDASPP